MRPNIIQISTGARLHFGFLAHAPESARQFGGVGLMVDQPGWKLRLQAAKGSADEIIATPRVREKLGEFLVRYRDPAADWSIPTPCRIEMLEESPLHVGFGSGTQLGMAVAQGLSLLAGENQISPEVLARRVSRGKRSALGMHGFHRGGLLVESGKTIADGVGTLVSRLDFPPTWRILLLRPQAKEGLSGTEEQKAFTRLEPMSIATTGDLCRVVLMELLPAVLNADFPAASEALHEFGRRVGEYFAPIQGGLFSDPEMGEVYQFLRRSGVVGICQSSWGPTTAVICRDDDHAQEVIERLDSAGKTTLIKSVASPLNSGAALEFPDMFTPSVEYDTEEADDVGQ
ncbi:MAG: hypothetical protein KDA36_07675 [Planctomycetaceae bacterium]|nr:hypothetical protein [Planctomycetaceae bacterium]